MSSTFAARFRVPFHETKFAALDLVSPVDAKGVFEGYASLFDREDLGRDVIQRGAFSASLVKRGTAGIRMLYQHDAAQPIGIWLSIAEDGRGLRVKGRLNLDVARAREVHSLMRSGALDGLSIGYRAVKATRDAKTGIRRLTEIDLWEISIVTFPMLPDARVTRVKQSPSLREGGLLDARVSLAVRRAASRLREALSTPL